MKLKKYQEQKKEKKKTSIFVFFFTNIISEYIQNTARLFFTHRKLIGEKNDLKCQSVMMLLCELEQVISHF